MEKELKEIGHNIQLKGIVIHQVYKTAGNTESVLKLAKQELKITKKENVFIANINKAYYKKSNPNYGIFGTEEPNFKEELNNYSTSKVNFFDFSVKSVEHYKKVISRSAPASGGLVVFSHFINTEKNHEYLLVLTTNNKDGYAINEDSLTITGIKNLDLSKIDVACLINLTKWRNFEEKTDTETKTYLSFVKGNKEVSNYFMAFIDCENKTNNSVASKRLMTALDCFCIQKKYDQKKTFEVKEIASNYGLACIKEKRSLSLATLSCLVDPENQDEFKEFASDEEYGVSEIISGETKVFKSNRITRYKTDDILLEFNNMLLTTNKIKYNSKSNELTIKNIHLDI